MQIKVNEEKYKVKKTQIDTDEYQYNIIPKKRNCKLCKKVFESNGNEFIIWTDDDGFSRTGYFCRGCMYLMKKYLKLINKNR